MNAEGLIDTVVAALVARLRAADDRAELVQRFASPARLESVFAEVGAPLELTADQPALDAETLAAAVQAALDWSVRTVHPRFFNQNFAGPDPVAVLGDWVGAALNTTQATFEVAPVFTLMERAVCKALAAQAGWTAHDGVLLPGGSMSMLHALHAARHRVQPEASRRGVQPGGRLVAFTSAEAHYSLRKAMALTGLGVEQLEVVPVDARGRMDVAALEHAIRRVKRRRDRPFFINATAGTTVRGAFDAIDDLADVAYFHDLWLHVDGCFGASALFSPETAHLMAGVERADSLAWNLHKMMGVTQQCAALLVRHPGLLARAFGSQADYLFQADKNHLELDSGDQVFHCARRVDAFKAWLTWKARGAAGFAARIEHARDLAAYARARVEADPRFALAVPAEWVNVVFWWVPPDLRPLDLEAPSVHQRLHGVTPAIKDRMQRAGRMLLSYSPIAGLPNAFRLLFMNPSVTRADVDAVLEGIDEYGQSLPRPI